MYHPFIEAYVGFHDPAGPRLLRLIFFFFCYRLALTLVNIPIFLGIIAVYSIIVYFIVGLQKTAGQFLCVFYLLLFLFFFFLNKKFGFSIFFLFLSVMALTMQAWFRAVAAAFKSEATAQSVAGVVLLAMVIYT